ncbi:MAG: DEAD/DEAH box helicase [Verrucomicrobiae bacterium]|nr:DEAD/DEAH box helicase [Verrucomicrobiae bacterium]NNJ42564.1 hypothetical protein [Akkermansiaceae bacterium]
MMEMTEQWIGKAAGGRVFKDARALVRLGKVLNVVRKEVDGAIVFQGSLSSGKRPMRVVVKVLGPTQVKNLCGCAMSRATGAMCEHAAAVMLAGLVGGQDKPSSHATVEEERAPKDAASKPVPMEVRLSPQFPYDGGRAVHLRRVDGAVSDEYDRALCDWLRQHTGRVDAAMLSIPERDLAGFYRAICGHTRVTRGEGTVDVAMGHLRPPLEMEVDGGLSWVRLITEGAESGLMAWGESLAAWDDVTGRLLIASPSSDRPGEPLRSGVPLFTTEDLLGGDWLEMETGALIEQLVELGDVYQLPDDLGGLDVCEGTPGIELEIAGTTRTLQARLVAVYAGSARVPLGVVDQSADKFPILSDDVDDVNRWLVRHPELERSALTRLMEAGFQVLDASGFLFLRGEDEVIDFLTTTLPALRKQWDVKTEEKLVRVESKLGRITPEIHIQGGGGDWLACDVAWQCGGEVIDRDVVRRLLQSGSRTMPLPRGGKAVISHFDAEVMEGFLLDTDPRQEDGRFYFPARQEAYVQRLRGYYGEACEDEKTAVPRLPDDLAQTLRVYQSEGVDWLYRRAVGEGAALLADDMGLGKTLQTLAFIQLWKTHGPESAKAPALVVCPATLLGNWRDEAAKFVPGLTVLVMHGSRRKDYYEVMGAADIIVTSFALLDRDCAHYQKMKLGALVLDEASAIRNPDTLAAKAARKVKAAVRIAITGTPVENSVRDLWSIFQFLMPGYLGSRDDFRHRYELPCAAEVPDRAAMQRLRWRTGPFMLRRTKSLVAKDLPPKIESIVWCDPSRLQREHYQGILQHGAAKVDALREQGGASGARMQMLTVLLRLRQSCCDLRLLDSEMKKAEVSDVSAKLARLMELLDEAQRGGHRVLVFSQFTTMLGLIRDELDREDIDYCYLDGATRDRSAVVDRFQQPAGPPVFLISLKAGGYGLTLTAADTVVLFDPWWNPAVEAQAADRIHRIGQTKPATIYKLITRGTVEEKILRLQEKKRGVISAAMGEVGDEDRPMMNGLSEGELRDLLG